MSIEPSILPIRLVCESRLGLVSSSYYYACEKPNRRLRLFRQQRLQSVQRRHVAYDSKPAIRQLLALFGSITIVIRWTSVSNIEELSCSRI